MPRSLIFNGGAGTLAPGGAYLRTPVPCNGCKACCKNDAIILHPDLGDRPLLYETVEMIHPITHEPALMLAKKPNGECLYLGEAGCTIHDHAPAICREFDCGKMYDKLSRPDRRRAISAGIASKEVLDAGRRVSFSRKRS